MNGEEHTGSYYAATRNDATTYPELADERECEICVIGGGFSGIATALTLAERGHDVVVLEQNRVGWGASGRNGGQLIGGLGGSKRLAKHLSEDQLWALKYRGNDIVKARVEQYGIECDLKFGYVEAALKERHMVDLKEDLADHEARGLGEHLEIVDRDGIRGLLGTNAYIGGMTNHLNGHLHPLNLCLGEAAAAVRLGVTIFEHSGVTEILHGDKVTVRTRKGKVVADKIVVAGNAYHQLEQRRLSGLVFPAGSYIIATEPLSDDVVEKINPQDLAVCDLNHVLDYFRLSADKRMLFGGMCNYSGREPKSISASMVPRMVAVYPELEGVGIDYEWGGYIGIVVNRTPLIGRIEPNVFYAMGYSGHGVSQTHMAGEIVADAIEGNTAVMEAYERVQHLRIPGGRWLGNQMIAAGMLYYRVRDLF